MPTCSAVNCKYYHKSKSSGKTIHKFPFRSPELLEKWIYNVGKKKDWKPAKGSVVCSDHFEKHCFIKTACKTTLRPDALPTIFDTKRPRMLWEEDIPPSNDVMSIRKLPLSRSSRNSTARSSTETSLSNVKRALDARSSASFDDEKVETLSSSCNANMRHNESPVKKTDITSKFTFVGNIPLYRSSIIERVLRGTTNTPHVVKCKQNLDIFASSATEVNISAEKSELTTITPHVVICKPSLENFASSVTSTEKSEPAVEKENPINFRVRENNEAKDSGNASTHEITQPETYKPLEQKKVNSGPSLPVFMVKDPKCENNVAKYNLPAEVLLNDYVLVDKYTLKRTNNSIQNLKEKIRKNQEKIRRLAKQRATLIERAREFDRKKRHSRFDTLPKLRGLFSGLLQEIVLRKLDKQWGYSNAILSFCNTLNKISTPAYEFMYSEFYSAIPFPRDLTRKRKKRQKLNQEKISAQAHENNLGVEKVESQSNSSAHESINLNKSEHNNSTAKTEICLETDSEVNSIPVSEDNALHNVTEENSVSAMEMLKNLLQK